MAFAPIPEYEGKSPYVFITYAQQDEKIAYSIAVKMFNEGFRIWSSAACGNPSNMRIAERLSNSAVAMVFLSKSYLKYASYKEFEPRIVMTSPKPKIVICLDDTPLGTDWNTVEFPAGIRYNPEFPQELWLRINSSDTLEPCRGAWPTRKMPLPFEDSPAVSVSVESLNEEEVSGELNSLNSVMSSFGAGLDDDDIRNISLFQKKKDSAANGDKWQAWKEKAEPSQEQEYYAIENLIDTTPMPAEKKQYDNMIGLIENFMEKSNRMREDQLKERISAQSETAPRIDVPTGDFVPLPLNEFDRVDMSGDTTDTPVIFTDSSLPYSPNDSQSGNGFVPMDFDYSQPVKSSNDVEHEGYTMTRSSNRTERFGNFAVHPTDAPIISSEIDTSPIIVDTPPDDSSPIFETIVDDRKFITSTEEDFDSAKLTYHLGALDNFDESNYIQEEKTSEPQSEIKFEPVDHTPVRFTDNDKIGLPALSFARPEPPVGETPESRKVSVKYRKRWRVAVRTRINHIEYENEMYKVNGRWIPGEIYHAKMPNAKYTEVKSMLDRTADEPAPIVPSYTRRELPRLNSDSRLVGAVNTFRTQKNTAELIPEDIRTAMRQRHEVRQAAAIRQLEIEQAIAESAGKYSSTSTAAAKTAPSVPEEEDIPARKHKFSHDAGIKKSLMLPMESPVDIDTEESSHRQYGARAEVTALYAKEESDKKGKKKKGEKSAYDRDEDALIALPTYGGQPKVNYDPSAYQNMNLSEILFSNALSDDGAKHSKKKKKK